MMKSFKQYNEAKIKEVVFTFGRFNPPTIGHGKLLAKVAFIAKGNNYRIYASQSNDSKKNPLQYKEKIKVMRKMFPKHGRNIIEDKKAKTAIDIAVQLYEQGFTKMTMVVGSDRIKEFQKLLNAYNGKKARHGFYDFPDGIIIESAGDRDPDADGVTGMSASKMRQAAIDGDFKSFALGLPKAYGEDMTLFNLIRKRMGLKEMNNFRKHIQLPELSEKRERYIAGEIFNEGDKAYTTDNVVITIKERKSNFVIATNGKKYFIHSLSEELSKPYGKGLGKSTKAKRQAQFNKQAKMDDDDPSAYKPAPGDSRAKTKVSKHTKAYHKKFSEYAGEFGSNDLKKKYIKDTPCQLENFFKENFGFLTEKQIAGLVKKAKESGVSYGILKKVFDRGMAAWKTGHRPGATPHQWAFARVNSFLTGGKTQKTTDADLWKKAKASKKESVDESKRMKYNKVIKKLKDGEWDTSMDVKKRMHLTYTDNNTGKEKVVFVEAEVAEGEGKYKGETWEDGFERRVVKTTDPEHLEQGFKWRIKGKERDEISIKLYKSKPDFEEYKKQMKRVAGHEFGTR